MNMKKLFVAAFTAVAALLFVACDSPESVVENFHEGVIDKDSEKIMESIYINADMREGIKMLGEKGAQEFAKDLYENVHEESDQLAELKSYEILGVVRDGEDVAYVIITYKKDGKEDGELKTEKIRCEKVNGDWKIFL